MASASAKYNVILNLIDEGKDLKMTIGEFRKVLLDISCKMEGLETCAYYDGASFATEIAFEIWSHRYNFLHSFFADARLRRKTSKKQRKREGSPLTPTLVEIPWRDLDELEKWISLQRELDSSVLDYYED